MYYIDKLLDVHIQPIYNIETLNIDYAEALVRPRGNKKVSEILTDIIKSGHSVDLDLHVFETICKLINETNSKTIITVNLCKDTIGTPNIVRCLIEILKRNRVDKNKILIEISETTNFNHSYTRENIYALYRNNIKLALDDFGTVNADLVNAIESNVSIIKFDKEYLYSDINQEKLAKYVRCINEIGIVTIIEGVETVEQLRIVKRLGFKYVQGFLLSKVLPLEEYKAY